MGKTRTLILGGGVTGLALAQALDGDDFELLEAEPEVGGYCRTVRRKGFVWDFSGHFFHFRDAALEKWLRERMAPSRVRTVKREAFVRYAHGNVRFPFQKNLHQLPFDEFLECLHGMFAARASQPMEEVDTFAQMLRVRFGDAVTEKFLRPYNEKLYATDLDSLDAGAMGRFFPHATFEDVLEHLRTPSDDSYNRTFTYPVGGAEQYVRALAKDVPKRRVHPRTRVTSIDLEQKRLATADGRTWNFDRLVSTAPLPKLLELCGMDHDARAFSWNQVLVFNLGFGTKGPQNVHWLYFPSKETSFYRVGFYDNLLGARRMSLYVELGFPKGERPDADAWLPRVLEDLRREGIWTGQKLVAKHSVVLDPAYVHVTKRGLEETRRCRRELEKRDVLSIGRYGAWKYCSIEDNILEARALAETWARKAR